MNEIYNLIQTTANIKSIESISIYYVKEIGLLSFNLTEIKLGENISIFQLKTKKIIYLW